MSQGRVLIVDDDITIRETIRTILNRAGYDVVLAGDGEEAIKLMSRDENASKVDALLSDLEMPGTDGPKLIAHFKTAYPMVPIIILSGASDFVLTETLLQQGVTDWLRKPATREKFSRRSGWRFACTNFESTRVATSLAFPPVPLTPVAVDPPPD